MSAMTVPARTGPGRPKDLAKRTAILEAAKGLFLGNGFAGVSMEQVAQAAGVSKLTVYSHFGDKDGLFIAAVRAHCEQELPLQLFSPAMDKPLDTRLMEIARAFFALITSTEAIAGHRILCTAYDIPPQLVESFWQASAVRLQTALETFLRGCITAGELEIDEPARAASHFFALVKGEIGEQLALGLAPPMDADCVQRHLDSVVSLFVRAYRP